MLWSESKDQAPSMNQTQRRLEHQFHSTTQEYALILEVVFENGHNLYKERRNDIESRPKIVKNKIKYVVESKFNDGSYYVNIERPEIMPGIAKPLSKTFSLTCTCGAFGDHGPKYCKHIIYIVMKYLNYEK